MVENSQDDEEAPAAEVSSPMASPIHAVSPRPTVPPTRVSFYQYTVNEQTFLTSTEYPPRTPSRPEPDSVTGNQYDATPKSTNISSVFTTTVPETTLRDTSAGVVVASTVETLNDVPSTTRSENGEGPDAQLEEPKGFDTVFKAEIGQWEKAAMSASLDTVDQEMLVAHDEKPTIHDSMSLELLAAAMEQAAIRDSIGNRLEMLSFQTQKEADAAVEPEAPDLPEDAKAKSAVMESLWAHAGQPVVETMEASSKVEAPIMTEMHSHDASVEMTTNLENFNGIAAIERQAVLPPATKHVHVALAQGNPRNDDDQWSSSPAKTAFTLRKAVQGHRSVEGTIQLCVMLKDKPRSCGALVPMLLYGP
jgi:hypothetical protein